MLFRQAYLVEDAQRVLGVLAGLNSLYWSTLQFKRLRRFVSQMAVAPPDVANRLDALFDGGPDAAARLRELVSDVAGLVEARMPEVDTSALRRRLDQSDL